MTKTMEIILPDNIAMHEGDIRYFIDSMMRKLSVNAFKGWADKNQVANLFDGITHETGELAKAVKNEGQFDALMEAADVANMALLTGIAICKQSRHEFEESKNRVLRPPHNIVLQEH